MISFDIEDGKQVEILSESICFKIDKKFGSKHALAILAALQSFIRDCEAKTVSWNKIHRQSRKYKLDLTVVCENNILLLFLCSWLRKESLHHFSASSHPTILKAIEDYDYYVDISLEKVLDVVRVGKLHLHQEIGILIGCDSKSLANLFVSDQFNESGTLILVNCEDLYARSRFEEAFGNKFKEVRVISIEDEDGMSDSLIQAVQKSEAVIGRRGFTTYAASCLKKPVLELINEDEDFSLLTTWSNKYYVPFILSESFDPQKGVNALCRMVPLFRDSLIQTVPETYFADNVAD